MNAVEELTGEEFSYDGTPLNKRVLRYFRELGNNIYSDVFGDVALNNSSVHDDLGHGKTKYKIASLKAVPAVIKKGVVIDSQRRGNGNYDRIIVAAPITIAKESYIMGVMLQRDKQSQRLYLHDVVAISKKETTKVGEVTPITTETATLNDSLYMTSILLKAYNVKEKTTYPNAKYSKDDTIFDDFEDEEVMFTADGDIAFDGFGADAQRTIDVKEMVQDQGAEHAVYTLYNAAALEMVLDVAAEIAAAKSEKTAKEKKPY